MTGAGSVSLREIGRVKSAATRVALLPVVDLAGYTANTAFWLARAANCHGPRTRMPTAPSSA